MDTTLTVQGNLTSDPTARLTAQGVTVANFRIASSSRKFDREAGEFRDGDPLYINVTCWRNLAVNAVATLRKGDSVVLHGRLLYRTFEDREGNKRSTYEIDALALGPDLTRYAADLRRPNRPAEQAAAPAVPEQPSEPAAA